MIMPCDSLSTSRYTDYFDSPLGMIEMRASDKGLVHVIFSGTEQTAISCNDITEQCKTQLAQYFSQRLTQFDLPLDLQGTRFQQSVWQCLTQIPFGQTVSYGEIANQLNNPNAVRAVGGANGRNPISIIVPCHRVIGASGTLTGYAGGITRKRWLLKHEGILLTNDTSDDGLGMQQVIKYRQAKTQFLK